MWNQHSIVIAHGALACIAWVIFAPLGSILVRVLKGPATWKVHAGIQLSTMAIFTVAAGLGLQMATRFRMLHNYHVIIGLVIFCIMWLQALFGTIHHFIYKSRAAKFNAFNTTTTSPSSSSSTSPTPSSPSSDEHHHHFDLKAMKHQPPKPTPPGRTWITHTHVWLGRIIITLAMINGGLGLLVNGSSSRAENIAYGVIAGVIWWVWLMTSTIVEGRKKLRKDAVINGVGSKGQSESERRGRREQMVAEQEKQREAQMGGTRAEV